MLQAPRSGNFLVDAIDDEQNKKRKKPCRKCSSEDGEHFCACGRELTEFQCAHDRCPDCI